MSNRIVVVLYLVSSLWALSARARTVEVKIENMKFEPAKVAVSEGDTVVWINKDLVPHTATAERGFDSKTIDPGGRWSYKASKAGHFAYKCFFHPTMVGDLVIRAR